MALKGALENELFRHVDGSCGRCCRIAQFVGSEYRDQFSGSVGVFFSVSLRQLRIALKWRGSEGISKQ